MSDQPDLNAETPVSAAVADHRLGTPVRDKLEHPFADKLPVDDELIEIADGVLWGRMPLPWDLDHINMYIIDAGDGWALIDTGVHGSKSIARWEAWLAGPLAHKPVSHIIATHMHPDHLGMAGWLAARTGAPLYMTMGEFMTAQRLWEMAAHEVPDQEVNFLVQNGMDKQFVEAARQVGMSAFRKGMHALPHSYIRLEDGQVLTLGQHDWRVIVGRGHSPEHACLYAADLNLFAGGDQILPEITSNVSVYAAEPEANPLAQWMTALDRMHQLDADPIVLPAHGPVFKGYHKRLEDTIDGHIRRMGRLHAACAEKPRSAVSAFKPLYNRRITGFDFFLAFGEAIAHLRALESVGLLRREDDAGVHRFVAQGTYEPDQIVGQLHALPGVGLRSLESIGVPTRG